MVSKLLESISREYEKKTPKSKALYDEARGLFPGGVQHNIRFFTPYPFYVDKAKGQHLYDVDGSRYVDFWMGHMALILGHSPRPVVEALRKQVENGTHFGVVNEQQVELGRKVVELVPCAEMIRFCCSGTEATMYATRLARGFTRRRVVLKIEGGWHGGNPALHRAVTSPYDLPESLGILEGETMYTRSIQLNDLEGARKAIHEYSSDLAMVLVEPLMGSGCIPSEVDFLKGLREETESRAREKRSCDSDGLEGRESDEARRLTFGRTRLVGIINARPFETKRGPGPVTRGNVMQRACQRGEGDAGIGRK